MSSRKNIKRSFSNTHRDLAQSSTKKPRRDLVTSSKFDQHTQTFKELLDKSGFLIVEGGNNVLNVDQAVFQKHLAQNINKDDDNLQIVEEFLSGLHTYIEDIERFKYTLMPTLSAPECQTVRCGSQDCLMHLLLGISLLQNSLMTILLEKLPEFDEADDSQFNVGRLLLNQFRWLDRVVDCKMVVSKMFEMVPVMSPGIQNHLITNLPEIIEEDQHYEVAINLQEMLLQSTQLTVPIIDALTNLNLDARLITEIRCSALKIVQSASTENLAVVVKFILQSVDSSNAEDVISALRCHLDMECSMLPQTSSTPRAGTLSKGNEVNTCGTSLKSGNMLLLDTIKWAMRFNKAITNGFLKAIEASTHDHMIIDLYVLLIVHSSTPSKKKTVQSLLCSKIKKGHFSIELLETAFCSHSEVFKDYFPSVLSLAECMMKSSSPAVCLFSTTMLQQAFLSLDMFCRQEVIGLLVTLIGSGFEAVVYTCLNVLMDLVQSDVQKVTPFSAFIKGILDYIDNLQQHQIRKLFGILSILAFNKKQGINLIQDDLHIFIRKQLSSDTKRYKKIGVLAALMVVSNVAFTRQMTDTFMHESVVADELCIEDFKLVTGLLELVKRSCSNMPHVTAMFYDELAAVVKHKNIHQNVQDWINEEIASEFQEKYVTDLDVGSVESEDTDMIVYKTCYSLEAHESEAGIAIDIISLTDAMEVTRVSYDGTANGQQSPVCAVCLAPLFRLLTRCEDAQTSSLDGIDALLGCPLKTCNTEVIEKFNSYSVVKKKQICSYLFFTINWFMENLNTFASQTDPELRAKVLQRLGNIVTLQKQLQICLAVTDNFVPTPATFGLEDATTNECFPTKGKYSSKKSSKLSATTTQLTNKSQLDESTVTTVDNTVDLKQFKPYFRELDMNVFTILDWCPVASSILDNSKDHNTLQISPDQVAFLLDDFVLKLNHSLNHMPAKRPGIKIVSGYCHLDQIPQYELVNQVITFTPSLCLHLENVSAYFQTLFSEEGCTDDLCMSSETSYHMATCYQLLLQALCTIISWSGFSANVHNPLLENYLMHLYKRVHTVSESKPSLPDLLRKAFTYMENFSTSIPNLNCAVMLLGLLISIDDKVHIPELHTKLGKLAEHFLEKKWSLMGEFKDTKLLQQLLRNCLTYSEDTFECILKITTSGMTELLNTSKNQHSSAYPTLTRQTFGCYFRTILTELVHAVKSIKSDLSINTETILLKWSIAVRVLHMHTNLIKTFNAKTNLIALLKYGQIIIKIFLQDGMPFFYKEFRNEKESILKLLKSLQHSTRAFHHICSHSKGACDVSLTKHVPPLKRTLENLVHHVKTMLALNNCQDAFWIGNLKNRDLQGEEIVSKECVSPGKPQGDGTDEDEEEDDVQNVVQREYSSSKGSDSESY